MINQIVVHGGALINGVLNACANLAIPSPGPTTPKLLNTDAIIGVIATKVAPIMLAALGVIFISRAGKGEISKVLTSSAIAVIGLGFIGGAGALFLFGESLIKLIFG